MKVIYTLTFLLFFSSGFAQIFDYESVLKTVDSNGYYKIFLPPQITSKLNADFTDIRIINAQEKEVPFIKIVDKKIETQKYHHFKILEKKYRAVKGYTKIAIHNPRKEDITNICLIVNNPQLQKTIKLAGSNDKKHWFEIHDFSFQPNLAEVENIELRLIDFPITTYEYYELKIYAPENIEIEVIKAFYYDISIKNIKYTTVGKPKVQQNDSLEQKVSIIEVDFEEPQYIDQLTFEFADSTYFLRKVEIYEPKKRREKKVRMEFFNQLSSDFFISSNRINKLQLANHKVEKLFLRIYNQNDNPLKIKSVRGYQLKHYLCASLDSGQQYKLQFGNLSIGAPMYDLRFFRDSLPNTMLETLPKEIRKIGAKVSEEEKIIIVPPAVMWGVAIVVIFLLAAMAFRIYRMDKKNV